MISAATIRAVHEQAPLFGLGPDTVLQLAEAAQLDPLAILTFLTAVIPLVMECLRERTPERVARHFRQNTKATRHQAKVVAHQAWRDAGNKGPMPEELEAAFLDRLANITDEEMVAVYRMNQ